jgi:hypothetical protein
MRVSSPLGKASRKYAIEHRMDGLRIARYVLNPSIANVRHLIRTSMIEVPDGRTNAT